LLPHDVCIRNAFRMVMSIRQRNRFLVHFHVLQVILQLLTILSDLSTNPMYAF
jgi:hypothetical protein